MASHPVLIGGQWRPATASDSFSPTDPTSGQTLPEEYPISQWGDCEAAMAAATEAFAAVSSMPSGTISAFLRNYAESLDAAADPIAEAAASETGLPKSPRLANVELPRTSNQLRQAAEAVDQGGWALPTIDTQANIRSLLAPLGPVLLFGPNNFPLAFNAISGGDFAAAVAAGNPVIARAHPSHPTTTRLLAEIAQAAAAQVGLPSGFIQVLYGMSTADGLGMVGDPRIAAVGFTGSRRAGLALKKVADEKGKPIYLEMSSINPVVILPGALQERAEQIAEEFTTSCLMGAGQFCTNPGLVLLLEGPETEGFVQSVCEAFGNKPAGVLLNEGVQQGLQAGVEALEHAGCQLLTGGDPIAGESLRFANTLFRASGELFLAKPEELQTEAFGNLSLFVVARNVGELEAIIDRLEGNLTGCFYTHTGGQDEQTYRLLEPILRRRVGRLLNDKMPTGVAVSSAMNHGGPFPATGHPGFTAVGIPASIRRFVMLQCYDNVRPDRLPAALRDKNPNGQMWRFIDGNWTQADAG